MANLKIENVAIKGIAACVPPKVEENAELSFYTPEEAAKTIKTIGIERRHVTERGGITVSDLCIAAARKLMDSLGWSPESVDLLTFCTQTPDYLNQPCAFIAHKELGLSEECLCVDYYHGCPGWIVGLNNTMALISSSNANPGNDEEGKTKGLRRAIFLDGDCVASKTPLTNHESKPLFGDAGTATALEYDASAAPIFFNHGTLSAGGEALIAPFGGGKNPWTIELLDKYLRALRGELNKDEETLSHMDGMDVFSFAISTVPKSMKKMASEIGFNIADVDKVILHQANKFICDTILKKLKVDKSKAPSSLLNYGNTTSASIPMSLVCDASDDYRNKSLQTLACGFGTGLSYASMLVKTDNLVVPDVVIYGE